MPWVQTLSTETIAMLFGIPSWNNGKTMSSIGWESVWRFSIVNRYADRSMVQQSRYNEERQLNAIAHLENELKEDSC